MNPATLLTLKEAGRRVCKVGLLGKHELESVPFPRTVIDTWPQWMASVQKFRDIRTMSNNAPSNAGAFNMSTKQTRMSVCSMLQGRKGFCTVANVFPH